MTMENATPQGPRVPLVQPGTRPELAALEARILAERGRISVLYQALLNSAPIAAGWEQMLTAVRNNSGLDAGLRELAILRVAVLNRAAFEFDAHVPHAQRAGVSEAAIAATRQTALAEVFTPLQRLVLELTDAMTRDVDVPDALMARVREHFDARGTVELVATIAAYNMVSRFLVALHIGH
jgi:AhpD family alkylhydroperoxidase